MCKLCNTDRSPAVEYKPRTSKAIIFLSIVHDYIGERPCRPCIRTVENKWNRTIKDSENLDRYILRKLVRCYYGEAKPPDKRISKAVAGVNIRTNPRTGAIAYVARVARSVTVEHIGSFNTLQEALQAKINYCIENNITRSLEYTKAKLKELQNETNIA